MYHTVHYVHEYSCTNSWHHELYEFMNHGGWSHARARVLRDSDFRQMHDMFGIIILRKKGLRKSHRQSIQLLFFLSCKQLGVLLTVLPRACMVQELFRTGRNVLLFWNCSEEKIKQLKGGGARNRESTVEHYFCMIFRFPVMQPPDLILAGRWPCMRRISHSGEIQIYRSCMHASVLNSLTDWDKLINACMIWLLAVWDRYCLKMTLQRVCARSVATFDDRTGLHGDFLV